MSWFRRKGKYWYFVERTNGKEKQHYIGSDAEVIRKLNLTSKILPNKTKNDQKGSVKRKKAVV